MRSVLLASGSGTRQYSVTLTVNKQFLPFDSYFIDIGVPEDYERAQFKIS